MKLRIISDIHRQINSKFPFELKDKDIFTLLAGDIGPDYVDNAQWIEKNIHNGAFVAGNHEAYGTSKDFTIEDVKCFYHEKFPLESNVTFFDYDVGVIKKDLTEKIMILADVMYTDYRYDPNNQKNIMSVDDMVERNMYFASPKFSGSYMNDFLFYAKNKIKDNDTQSNDKVNYITPRMYLEHFNATFLEIDRIVNENKDKDIILMTHHCLSPECIGPDCYKGTLAASYVSDRVDWINKHDNIKLIVSGHVHNRMKFNIGSSLYIMNPRGYCYRNEDNGWNPDLFVDTDTWSVV